MPLTPNYRGLWNTLAAYASGDLATYQGSTWITINSLLAGAGAPGVNPSWVIFAQSGLQGDSGPQGDLGRTGPGIRWLGDYDSGRAYRARDAVAFSHSAFICLSPPPIGTAPLTGADIHSPVDVHWNILALGVPFIFKGTFDVFKQYYANDVVSFNNSVYVALRNSLGVMPTDIFHWDLMIATPGDMDNFLPLAGGTMTGNIVFHTGQAFPGAGAVDSVNTQTGDVVLGASDVGADPAGAAFTAQTNSEGYTDSAISAEITRADGAYDVSGAASTAQSNAEAYADGLAVNYDPAGAASTAQSNAESYADGLAGNYDPAGAAGTAEFNADAYADGLISAEVSRADGAYDPAGAAATAQSNAEAYADGLAGNYDPAGAASTAQANAESYADAVASSARNVRYSTDFNWILPYDSSWGALAAGVQATLTLAVCPAGIDTTGSPNLGGPQGAYSIYIAGVGTAEAVKITGGTGTAGQSGTLIFTPFFNHGTGYTLGSATAGVQEAINDGGGIDASGNFFKNSGCRIVIPPSGSATSVSKSFVVSNIVETAGNVVTLTCTGHTFVANDEVNFTGLTTGTWLNGHRVTLTLIASNTIAFADPTSHGVQASHSETGTATAVTNTAYDIYDTIYFHANGSILSGYGAILNHRGRGPCLQVGNLLSASNFGDNRIEGIAFRAPTNRSADPAFAGSLITSTQRVSGVITITTTAPHGFRTGDMVCQMLTDSSTYWGDVPSITVVDSVTYTYPRAGSADVPLQSTPGVVALSYEAILDNAECTHFVDVSQVASFEAGKFNHFFDIWDDENCVIERFNNDAIGLNANALWTGSYIWSGGSSQLPNRLQQLAGVISFKDGNITANTSNGFTVYNSNGLYISNSVVQGTGPWQVYVSNEKGNFQGASIQNIYSETGAALNPLSPAASPWPGCGNAGLISGAGGGSSTISGLQPVLGDFPTYGSGSITYVYYIVIKDVTAGTQSSPLPVMYWKDNGSGTPAVRWPRVSSGTHTITYDILRTIAPAGTINAAAGGFVAPYTGGCPGGSPSACGSVAVSLSQGAGFVNTFTDDTTVSTTAYPTVARGTYAGNLPFWPGSIISMVNPVRVELENSLGVGVGLAYQPLQIAKQGSAFGANTSGQTVCSSSQTSGNSIANQSATFMNDGPTAGGTALQSKGRLNFWRSPDSTAAKQHIITLVDSNPAKTISTTGYRPIADANDTWIGLDNNGATFGNAQLAIGTPISLSHYIANIGDDSSWKERLTANLKTFAVPVTLNGSNGLTLTTGLLKLGSLALVGLPTGTGGELVYATDGGDGTGTLEFYSNGGWHKVLSVGQASFSDISGTLALTHGGTNADLSASGSATAFLAQDASHVISSRSLTSTDIPSLDAGKITTGTFAADRYVVFTGDSGLGGVQGAVPAPAAGDAAASKFLKADGTWVTPSVPSSGVWSGISAATADLTLANTTFNTTFTQTSAANWTWKNTTAATSAGVVGSSPILHLSGHVFSSGVDTEAGWAIQNLMAPTTALNYTITNISENSGNVVILTIGAHSLAINHVITPTGLTTGIWLNNTNVVITDIGGTTITFTDPTAHGTQASHAETGTVTQIPTSTLTLTPSGTAGFARTILPSVPALNAVVTQALTQRWAAGSLAFSGSPANTGFGVDLGSGGLVVFARGGGANNILSFHTAPATGLQAEKGSISVGDTSGGNSAVALQATATNFAASLQGNYTTATATSNAPGACVMLGNGNLGNNPSFSATSGSQIGIGMGYTTNSSTALKFAPTTGTATFNAAILKYSVNQTGGANGVVTGLLINSVETAVGGTHTLFDLQAGTTGGTSRYSIDNAGITTEKTANGAQWIHGQASELLTLSTSGTTTDTSANLLPANSIIEAVVARVTTTITTATDWKLGDPTTAGRFIAADATMTAGETQVGTVQADQTGAAGPRQVAAAKVRVTTTGTPGAGAIRITVFYRQFAAPAS